jgi:hypothetical protein
MGSMSLSKQIEVSVVTPGVPPPPVGVALGGSCLHDATIKATTKPNENTRRLFIKTVLFYYSKINLMGRITVGIPLNREILAMETEN